MGGAGGRGGKKNFHQQRGGSFPIGFCGAGLSKRASAELANKQRSCSHRDPGGGQYRPPTERGEERGGGGREGGGRTGELKKE